MAELVDAIDLGSIVARRGGSSPFTRTILKLKRKKMTEIKKVFDKNLEKKFTVTVKASELVSEMDKEAQNQQQKLKVDGFRKGKVPLDFIKNKYSALLLSETAERLVEKHVAEIVKENKLNVIGRPKIDVKNLDINKDFEFEVAFDLFPEIPEIKYNKINVKKQKVKVSQKDIEEGKQKLLKTKADWKEQSAEYKSKLGDKVNIDFLGKLNGVPFEGGKAEGYGLELGSKSFIDNFEEQLVDKKAGDQVEVKVTFPKEYHKKDLSGQKVVFEVKVHSVSTPTLPELTDGFLKENFGIENVTKLEEMIEKELTSMYGSATHNKLKSDIFEWLDKNVKFDMPKSIIEEEYNRQWSSVENELKNNPQKFKNDKEKQEEQDEIRANAERSVKLGLILSETGKANNIKVEDSEIIEEIRKKASMYQGQEQMIVDFYMKNKNALNQISGALLEDKVVEFVTSQANLAEEEITVEEFLKK